MLQLLPDVVVFLRQFGENGLLLHLFDGLSNGGNSLGALLGLFDLLNFIILLVVQQTLLVYFVEVYLHRLMLRQELGRILERLDGQVLLVLGVVVAAQVQPLLALEFVVGYAVRALAKLVVEWAVQLLDQRVAILALKLVGTLVPAAVILHILTPVQIVKIKVGWPSEILLSVREIALRPLVLFVDERAKTGLI